MKRTREQLLQEIDETLKGPEATENPGSVLSRLEKTRNALFALFDHEDPYWEEEYYTKRPDLKEIKERIEQRVTALREQAYPKKPSSKPKQQRTQPIMRIETNLEFRSLHQFLRAIDTIRLLFWNHRRELSNKLIKQDVAKFISIFASVTEEDILILPGSDQERAYALKQFETWSGATKNVAEGSHQDWLNCAASIAQSINVDAAITPRTSQPPHTPPQE